MKKKKNLLIFLFLFLLVVVLKLDKLQSILIFEEIKLKVIIELIIN